MAEQTGKPFAVVVDDESVVRKMLSFALKKEGFICHSACDGEEAMQLISSFTYDLVITDLAMPHKNGHALAVELLKLEQRPLIAVHTAVLEPRLAKDLVKRGVDDITFKPTDYAFLATKLKLMVERRSEQRAAAAPVAAAPVAATACRDDAQHPQAEVDSQQDPPVSALDLAENTDATEKSPGRWASLGIESLPFSQTALAVCRMACDDESDVEEIAAAIEGEPALTAELLRLGNSCYYNSAGDKTLNLEEIIVRVGRRHVGELALALNACSSLRDDSIPNFNVRLNYQRSLAAGIAVQVLVSQQGLTRRRPGLMLSAVMHLLGRMVFAKNFREEMVAIMDLADQTGEPLSRLEQKAFSLTQSQMLARLLLTWQVPEDVVGPLRHLETPYEALAELSPTEKEEAELFKVAVLVGWLAVGRWEKWDLIEFPPPDVFQQLCPISLSELVDRVRNGFGDQLADQYGDTPYFLERTEFEPRAYACLGSVHSDFLVELLPALGIHPERERESNPQTVIVNCLDSTPVQLKQNAELLTKSQQIVWGSRNEAALESLDRPVLRMPCTIKQLEDYLAAKHASQSSPVSQ